jgi:two-component system response regulator HydG
MTMPPLRDRRSDIRLLAEHFLKKYCHETTKRVDRILPGALKVLEDYVWPGNVRELENAIERAVVLSRSRALGEADFTFLRLPPSATPAGPSLREMEKYHIRTVLAQHGWNITRAAKALEINRVTLHKKIKRYALRAQPDATTIDYG